MNGIINIPTNNGESDIQKSGIYIRAEYIKWPPNNMLVADFVEGYKKLKVEIGTSNWDKRHNPCK